MADPNIEVTVAASRPPRAAATSGVERRAPQPDERNALPRGGLARTEHVRRSAPLGRDQVRAGEEARVTVVVDTELHWQSIPPGFVQELEDGRLLQQYFHDFLNYAGLHRSVWLRPSSCCGGSARTRSAPRTTPTTRRSSTTPTGTASWSSTAAVGLNLDIGAGILNRAEPIDTCSDATIEARTEETHFTPERRPKAAAHALRRRRRGEVR